MPQPETQYVRSGDANIAYQIVGDGPVDLLYLFGIPLSIDAIWDREEPTRFFSNLASFSRLLIFDRRGIGLSDPISSASLPIVEQVVEDALAVLNAAGSTSAAVIGTDLVGGHGALVLSATHPERVSHLIVCHTVGKVRRPSKDPAAAYDHRAWLDTSPALKAAPSKADDASFNDWWTRSIRRAISPGTRHALSASFDVSDVRPILPTIRVPTLVLHRRDNDWVPVALARRIADQIPGAALVELEGADALLFVGDSDAVVAEVQEFVTGARPTGVTDRVLATIMFSDIVSSTESVAATGDKRWTEKLDAHDAAIQRQLERFGGRHVNTTGDGFVATFDGPARAIHCAGAVHDALQGLGLQVRIGVHTGEVERRRDDVAGISVHIAQRISDAAEPGRTMVSSTVTDLVAGSGISFEDRGSHELKGIPGVWRLSAVIG